MDDAIDGVAVNSKVLKNSWKAAELNDKPLSIRWVWGHHIA